MSKPRFQFTYGTISNFADRLRIGQHDCEVTKRFYLVLYAGDPANEDPTQAPLEIDLPKKDRSAYQRAALAFNAVLDEHEAKETGRKARRSLCGSAMGAR